MLAWRCQAKLGAQLSGAKLGAKPVLQPQAMVCNVQSCKHSHQAPGQGAAGSLASDCTSCRGSLASTGPALAVARLQPSAVWGGDDSRLNLQSSASRAELAGNKEQASKQSRSSYLQPKSNWICQSILPAQNKIHEQLRLGQRRRNQLKQ